MHGMQSRFCQPVLDGPATQASGKQLLTRDHPMLPGRKPGDVSISGQPGCTTAVQRRSRGRDCTCAPLGVLNRNRSQRRATFLQLCTPAPDTTPYPAGFDAGSKPAAETCHTAARETARECVGFS